MKKLLIFLAMLLMLLSCANPIDRTPVRWRSAFDLPLMNRQFSFGDILKDNADSSIAVQGINNPPRGDTLGLFFSETTSIALSQKLCNFSPVAFNRKVEKITVSTKDSVWNLFPFNTTSGAITVSSDMPISGTADRPVPGVYYALFDSTCPDLPLTIRNVSDAPVTNLIIQVLDHGNVFISDTVASLAARTQVIKSNPIKQKSIDSVLTYSVLQGTISSSTHATLQPGDGLYVGFCLNSMTIAHAQVDDTIAVVNNRYLQTMVVSDTINVHSIDISSTKLDISSVNGVDEKFEATGEWLDLWDIDVCNADSVFDHSAIGKLSHDSTQYSRTLMLDTVISPHGSLTSTIGATQHHSRLFPVWDATGPNDSASVCTMALNIHSVPENRRVTIDKNDTVTLHITPRQTVISQVIGVAHYPITMAANRIAKAINFPGLTKDNTLRDRLLFNGALMSGKINLQMDSASSIDSSSVNIKFSTPGSNPVRDTLAIGMHNLHNAALYNFSQDISRVVDAYPDTLTMDPVITIPPNSGLTLHPAGAGDSSNNAIALHANINYGIKLPLNFTIRDTAQVLITDSTKIGGDSSSFLNKMEIAEVVCHFQVRNTSGVPLRLYGVAGADSAKQTLFSLSAADLNPTVVNSRYGTELFNLTGDSGLVVLPNDSLKDNTITLTSADYQKLTTANKLYLRWNLSFIPVNGPAVIRETDLVTIKASSHIESVQNMDSLMHAGK